MNANEYRHSGRPSDHKRMHLSSKKEIYPGKGRMPGKLTLPGIIMKKYLKSNFVNVLLHLIILVQL